MQRFWNGFEKRAEESKSMGERAKEVAPYGAAGLAGVLGMPTVAGAGAGGFLHGLHDLHNYDLQDRLNRPSKNLKDVAEKVYHSRPVSIARGIGRGALDGAKNPLSMHRDMVSPRLSELANKKVPLKNKAVAAAVLAGWGLGTGGLGYAAYKGTKKLLGKDNSEPRPSSEAEKSAGAGPLIKDLAGYIKKNPPKYDKLRKRWVDAATGKLFRPKSDLYSGESYVGRGGTVYTKK